MSKIIYIGIVVFLLIFQVGCTEDCQKGSGCSLEPDPGPCKAYFPKYYYDQEEETCKEFIWGGCNGTVPFETLEECQTKCGCME